MTTYLSIDVFLLYVLKKTTCFLIIRFESGSINYLMLSCHSNGVITLLFQNINFKSCHNVPSSTTGIFTTTRYAFCTLMKDWDVIQ